MSFYFVFFNACMHMLQEEQLPQQEEQPFFLPGRTFRIQMYRRPAIRIRTMISIVFTIDHPFLI